MLNTRQLVACFATILTTASLSTADETTVSLVGVWEAIGDLPDGGTNESTITVTKDDSKFKAISVAEDGQETNIDRITVDGKKVTLEVDLERDGQTGIIRVKAEQTEVGKLSGKWYLIDSSGEQRAEAPWKAVREDPPADIIGRWDAKATTGDGQELASVVTFAKDGDKITGGSKSERNDTKFDSVKIDGKKVVVEMTLNMNDNELDVKIAAEQKAEDHLAGKWVIFDDTGQEAATGPWEAKRVLELDLVGTWDAVATTDDGDNTHQAVFSKKDDKHQGSVKSDNGSIDYTVVKVDGNDIKLEFPFGEGTVKIAASYKEKDKLTGKWTYFDTGDTELASNDWIATRKAD